MMVNQNVTRLEPNRLFAASWGSCDHSYLKFLGFTKSHKDTTQWQMALNDEFKLDSNEILLYN